MISFVSKYIFPGGCLLLSEWVQESAMRNGLVQVHREFYGLHYAKTLAMWRQRFNENWENRVNREEYDGNLFKMWNFYLANCEAVFHIGYVDLVQQIFVKRPSDGQLAQFREITNPNQFGIGWEEEK